MMTSMSPTKPASRYRLMTEEVAWSQLEPNAVLIQLDRNEVHLANPVAAAIVESLQSGSATRDELLERVLEKFEVDAAQAAIDLEQFLGVALEAGIIAKE